MDAAAQVEKPGPSQIFITKSRVQKPGQSAGAMPSEAPKTAPSTTPAVSQAMARRQEIAL
jgi:hypothetical protein